MVGVDLDLDGLLIAITLPEQSIDEQCFIGFERRYTLCKAPVDGNTWVIAASELDL